MAMSTMAAKRRLGRLGRHFRVRQRVEGSPVRPRLAVFRSLKHIYAQVIDDTAGHTLSSASTRDAELAARLAGKPKKEQAAVIGQAIAERSQAAGIQSVVFDRGGFRYHGRIQALADAAREAGLNF